jgi:predicted DNA-binding transcriptional regulator AlpA
MRELFPPDALETAAAEPAESPATDNLGTARQVKRHFGEVSDMWLWRRLRDDPTFPRPLVINGRRYWRWSELRIWEDKHRVMGEALA